MTHLLFWDIDGTLLTTARAGVFALEEAALEVCGTRPDLSGLFTAGLTDAEIAAAAIEMCGGKPSDETVAAFLRFYERHLPDRLHWRRGSALPGAREILEDLAERPSVICLLLTGNTPAGAEAKLRHYGLWGYFRGGAFCATWESRESIARRALDVARRHAAGELRLERLFVIGDTPHDIRCGQAIGVRTVAVASGPHSLEELRACAPWLALERLPAPSRFSELLGLAPAPKGPPAPEAAWG